MSDAPERIWVGETALRMWRAESEISLDRSKESDVGYVRDDLYEIVEKEWQDMRTLLRDLRDEAIQARQYSYLATTVIGTCEKLDLDAATEGEE